MSPPTTSTAEEDGNVPQPRPSVGRISTAVIALITIVAFQHMASKIMTLPLNRVIESRYCLEYYRAHDPSVIGPGGDVLEELCKVDEVQRKLAWLQGSIETLHVFCGE
jgi:hypothetical protein